MNTTKQIVAGGLVAVAALIGAPLASAQPQPPAPCDVEATPADAEVECVPVPTSPPLPTPTASHAKTRGRDRAGWVTAQANHPHLYHRCLRWSCVGQ